MLTFINSIINLIYQRLPSTKHFFKQKTTNSSSPHHQQHIHQSSHFHLKYHRHQSTLSLSLSLILSKSMKLIFLLFTLKLAFISIATLIAGQNYFFHYQSIDLQWMGKAIGAARMSMDTDQFQFTLNLSFGECLLTFITTKKPTY